MEVVVEPARHVPDAHPDRQQAFRRPRALDVAQIDDMGPAETLGDPSGDGSSLVPALRQALDFRMDADTLLADEGRIRLTVFVTILAAMALWELAAPRRRLDIPRVIRWSNNIALVVLDTVLVRLAFPVLAVGAAVWAEGQGIGLFPLLGISSTVAVVAALLILDLAIWTQHRLFHAIPAFWRLHRMHHADLDFDVTTGLRFHPAEILLSMAIKIAVVVGLGAPPAAVLVFEVILSATALFNHANIRLGDRADRLLRMVVVTPDMHRVHHSAIPDETNSNFGFNLPWWDRLFGTYRAQPRDGHGAMRIGLNRFRNPRELWLDRMLVQPLNGPASDAEAQKP
jgi:sterol desaturase/sphingolipid hydroxylase (fatty acid hydroxylase superfamily)